MPNCHLTQETLLALYRQHFGYVGAPYPGAQADRPRISLPAVAPADTLYTPTPAEFAAVEGTGLFMPVGFGDRHHPYGQYQLPNEPLVSISGSKQIVRTPMEFMRGSIKENMGLNDYAITIQDVAVNEFEDDYPWDAVAQLRKWCERNESIPISCPVLELFNITLLTIESWEFPAEEGQLSCQPCEIKGYSDFDVETLIQDNLATPAEGKRR